MITIQDLKDRFAEFVNLTDVQLQAAINDSGQFLNSGQFYNHSVWGTRYDTAWIYLAAHFATLFFLRGQRGIAMRKEGDLAISAMTGAGKGGYLTWLNLTGYGEIFLGMVRTLVIAPLVTGQATVTVTGSPFPLGGDVNFRRGF